MSLDPQIRASLTLPAICAPMFLVTGPALVTEACKAGVIGGLPRQNARSLEEFEAWLVQITEALQAHQGAHPTARIAPIAVNYPTRMPEDELAANMALCAKYGVKLIISVGGDPTELVARVHGFGGQVFHDITRSASPRKPSRRAPTGSTASAPGAAATRARSATWPSSRASGPCSTEPWSWPARSAPAPPSAPPRCWAPTSPTSAPASSPPRRPTPPTNTSSCWSARPPPTSPTPATSPACPPTGCWKACAASASTPTTSPSPPAAACATTTSHPASPPWRNLWSAGQSIDLIDDVPTVAELVRRLRAEYVAACETPSFVEAARAANSVAASGP